MSDDRPVMIVTDLVTDAEMIRDLIQGEFHNIILSTDPDHTVADFEQHCPSILILAFNTLEKVERYYLGLYRLSDKIHSVQHRTIVLCNKADLKPVYQLCKKEYFDDFVLFWPPPNDPFRLPFSVHRALKELERDSKPPSGEFAAQARRLSGLDKLIEKHAASGNRLIEQTSRSARHAESTALKSLDDFYASLTEEESNHLARFRDTALVQQKFEQLKREGIEKPFQSLDQAIQPMRQWADSMQSELKPKLEATRTLSDLAGKVPPTVLVVDDDKFQHKLIRQILVNEELELIFSTSGAEALGALRRCKPDLILMDINLPGESGIEVTQQIKSNEQFAEIPVIMITGEGAKNVVVDSVNAGAVDFIVKPFNTETLVKKIHRFVDGQAGKER